MSDKVKDALDHASSLRFPENVLADEVRRLTAALSEAQRERDALLATAQAACGWPGHGEPSEGRNWVEELAGFLRVTQSQRDTAWDRERAAEAERDALKGEVERFSHRAKSFENASDYDLGRDTPASSEAHDIWFDICDKPHWALPTIQSVINERDAAVKRAEEAERFQLDAEKAYCGSVVFTEVLEFFEQAGCGKPGTPNTVWAMTQEIIRRAEAAESKLALAEWVVEAVKPLFSRFPQHRSPLDVELPNISELKELQGRLNQYTKME